VPKLGGITVKNIEIREFKLTVRKYIDANRLPSEVKRMVLKEIYEEEEQKANNEMIFEIKERDSAANAKEVKDDAESS